MPAPRTEITELATGLGTLGSPDIDAALARLPLELVNVEPEVWDRLVTARAAGEHPEAFEAAFANGRAFLEAVDGLRRRPPRLIEWKGPHRPQGLDPVPVDLRIDHVYLVSCKYASKVLLNTSPASLFGGTETGDDWYAAVAPEQYQQLYAVVRSSLDGGHLPPFVSDLAAHHREHLRSRLSGKWPPGLADPYRELAAEVGRASAARWRMELSTRSRQERVLWRLLRITSAPYYVLGTGRGGSMRLRVSTPWDWRRRFAFRRFEIWGDDAGQPQVRWRAEVMDRELDCERTVDGHVEVRWSHGRFAGPPEAKVYLDTPHEDVPGYIPLIRS